MNHIFKRVLCVIALLLTLGVAAIEVRATDITITSISFPAWQRAGTTARLRAYASTDFTASDGTNVIHGTTGATSGFFRETTCTVASTTVTCASLTLPSTDDALDNRDALWSLVLFDGAGRVKYETVSNGWVLSTSWGGTVTLGQWRVYNNTPPRYPPDPGTPNYAQMNAAIAAQWATGNPAKPYASPTPLGRVALSTPAADPSLPIAVSKTDPIVHATVNVMATDYGAVGDGVTDDTAAIQAAVNALSWIRGGVLTVPGGLHYKTTANITFPRVQQFGAYSTVTIYAYGAVFEPTAAVTSVFYYHPASQTVNDNVIYNSIRIFGAQFKAAARTAGQTAIDISSCEGCRFQDIDVTNMNGLHGRTLYRGIIENFNIQVTNEYGFKIESGDWSGAVPSNSPSNGTVIRHSRVIPGSGSLVSFWFINADQSGIEDCIHDAPDGALYPGSGSPQYEAYFNNAAYTYGQTNWVRGFYTERPSIPSVAVIGASLNNGTLVIERFRRFDDAPGVVYVDATGSTADSTIKLRDWPRMDASLATRFKTASGVQWRFDGVGEAAKWNFQNAGWWVGGTVGAVSQWGLNGIVVGGDGSSGTGIPAVQLGRFGNNAEASFGISRGPDFFLLGTVSGDVLLRATDRTKRLIFGVGDGTSGNDKAVLTIDSGASGVGTTGLLILENGVPRRVSVGINDSGGAGFRLLRIPN